MKKLYITLRNKSNSIAARAKIALDSKRAEMYVDKGVGIIIAVVVGGVLLAGIIMGLASMGVLGAASSLFAV